MTPKIALLIDAENISYKDLPRILNKVERYGEIKLKAVYGNWDSPHLQHWHEVAEQTDFILRHQANLSKTKNASDMRLIMDAMEIIHHLSVKVMCLVTNDADYVPLCEKLRESKCEVIGVGYEHASETFMRACDHFIILRNKKVPKPIPVATPVVQASVAEPMPAVAQKPVEKLPDVRKLVSQAFAKAPQEADNWVLLSNLGTALRQVKTDFQSKQYGHATLTKLLQTMPDFVELKGSAGDIRARLKKKVVQKPTKLKNLNTLVSEAFANVAYENDGWVTLSALGTALRQVQTGFQSKTYGHATLSKLLQTMSDFVELKDNGNGKSARLKPEPKLKKPSTIPKTTPAPVKTKVSLDPKQKRLQDLISAAFIQAPKDGAKWVHLSALGSAIHQIEADFQSEHYGHATLSQLLENMPGFVEVKNNGNGKSARLKK